MTARPFRMRVRSVRMKAGGARIEVLRQRSEDRREGLLARWPTVLQVHGPDIDGFAIVVWARDGGSTADMAGGDQIPFILVPDFVRNRLLAYGIEKWVRETLSPPRPPGAS